MSLTSVTQRIVAMGQGLPTGSYLLRIQVLQPLSVAFGRFEGGRKIAVPSGHYLYVGSAMGQGDQPLLARRVIRHASRSADFPPHFLRQDLLSYFEGQGWSPAKILPRAAKKRFWHIDYLLDHEVVHLIQAILIYSDRKLECALAEYLEDDANTTSVEQGLGASDHPGHSHLLAVHAPECWWTDLPLAVEPLILER